MANQTFSCFELPVQGDTTDLGSTLATLVVTPGAYPLPATLKQHGRRMEQLRADADISVSATSSLREITVDDAL